MSNLSALIQLSDYTLSEIVDKLVETTRTNEELIYLIEDLKSEKQMLEEQLTLLGQTPYENVQH